MEHFILSSTIEKEKEHLIKVITHRLATSKRGIRQELGQLGFLMWLANMSFMCVTV